MRRLARLGLNLFTALLIAAAAGLTLLALHSYHASSRAVFRVVSYVDGVTDWRYTQARIGFGWVGVASIRRVVHQNWFRLPDPTHDLSMFDYEFAEQRGGQPYAYVPGYAAWQGWKYEWGNFQIARPNYGPPEIYRGYSVTVPWWSIVAGLLAMPALRAARWARRRRRARRNCCVACGYDLRGSPGRCPECGTIPAGWAQAPDARVTR